MHKFQAFQAVKYEMGEMHGLPMKCMKVKDPNMVILWLILCSYFSTNAAPMSHTYLISESRTFWIGWKQQHIAVGKGLIPFQHQLVVLIPIDEVFYKVSAVSFKTATEVDGVWTVDKFAGKKLFKLKYEVCRGKF